MYTMSILSPTECGYTWGGILFQRYFMQQKYAGLVCFYTVRSCFICLEDPKKLVPLERGSLK